MQKKTLTHWCEPDEILASGYGNITYREWCEREQQRINAKGGRRVKIVSQGQDRYIALAQ